jgi:hypothetical protein
LEEGRGCRCGVWMKGGQMYGSRRSLTRPRHYVPLCALVSIVSGAWPLRTFRS